MNPSTVRVSEGMSCGNAVRVLRDNSHSDDFIRRVCELEVPRVQLLPTTEKVSLFVRTHKNFDLDCERIFKPDFSRLLELKLLEYPRSCVSGGGKKLGEEVYSLLQKSSGGSGNSPLIFDLYIKEFSLVEKIVIVAVSILLGVAAVIGCATLMKPSHLHLLAVGIIVPVFSMYLISDVLKAVQNVRKRFG